MRYLPGCATTLKITTLALPLIIFACSGNGDNTDGGADSSTDVTVNDSGKDSSADAKADTGNDAGIDSGSDASGDAGGDASDGASDDASDSGTDAIADASTDAITVTCGSKMGYGFVSTGDAGICGTGEDYTCSTDKYQIECDCPSAKCTCKKNGSTVGSAASYAGCPTCSTTPAFSSLAAGCGIPY